MRRFPALILIALIVSACAPADTTITPIAATQPAATDTAALSVTPEATATDAIDARLTSVALTSHPQLTQTAEVIGVTSSLQAVTVTAQAILTINAPPPTATLPHSIPQVIAEAPVINYNVEWSPNSQWIGYWVGERVMYESTPTFYNLNTRIVCDHPNLKGGIEPEYSDSYLYWLPDNRVVIVADGSAHIGTPCGLFSPAPDEYSTSPYDWAVSPNGSIRAESFFDEETQYVSTVFTALSTGGEIHRVDWLFGGGQRPSLGGQWITDDLFLITATADFGPLLIDLNTKDTISVLPELFGIEPFHENNQNLYAFGTHFEAAGSYHIILNRRGDEPAYKLLLYHSETQEVEMLPYNDTSGMSAHGRSFPGFSPDGQHLMVQSPEAETIVYTRPVDALEADFTSLGQMIYAQWANTGLIAYKEYIPNDSVGSGFVIASFPDLRILSHWSDDDMIITPWGWSPDGTMLLAHGFVPDVPVEQWRNALFLIEP